MQHNCAALIGFHFRSPEMPICAERSYSMNSGQRTVDSECIRLRRMFIEKDYRASSETEPVVPARNISIGARADRHPARRRIIERELFLRAEGWIARRGDFLLPAFVCFLWSFLCTSKESGVPEMIESTIKKTGKSADLPEMGNAKETDCHGRFTPSGWR